MADDRAPAIDVRKILEAHGLRARKSFGQNFLRDHRVLERIAEAAVKDGQNTVIEIGAGLGSLTAALANTGANVVAIEHDARLVPILRDTFAPYPTVQIVEGDATQIQFASLVPAAQKPSIAGNLPYNVSTPLLLAMLSQRDQIGPATVMLQREVGDRLRADPGGKEYGSITALFTLYTKVTKLFDVPPGAFVPAPKVHSSVLRFEWRAEPLCEVPAQFESVLRAAFGQRRKTLRNSLSARFDRGLVEEAGAKAAIDLTRRAETLTVQELAKLAWTLVGDRPRDV